MGKKGDHYTAQLFIEAIPGTGGIISAIARKVGCAWHTAKKYIDNYPTVNRVYSNECEKVLDRAESVVLKSIVEEEDVSVAKWFLTMKGRQRGYMSTHRQEVTGEDGGPVQVKYAVEMTDDELANIASRGSK